MLVEDESAIRRLTTRILGMLGVSVLEAETGQECLRVLSENEAAVDAVISDLRLPDIEGTELAIWIREQKPGTPIIYFTGSSRLDMDQDELNRYDTYFLAKPFTKDSITAVLDEVFASA